MVRRSVLTVALLLAACDAGVNRQSGGAANSVTPADGGGEASTLDSAQEVRDAGEALPVDEPPLDADDDAAEVADGAAPDGAAQAVDAGAPAREDAAVLDAAAQPVPSFRADILPILIDQCLACHNETGIAFSLETYAAARAYADVMADVTSQRTMPVCSPGDARCGLTQDEIAAIGTWARGGAPE
jgi:hypothetical protein